MADERDPDVSRRYRELGAEEPPRALDDAILAASRNGLKRRNWYAPVALAATLVLVVAVSIQVERQKPDEEFLAQAPQPAAAPIEKKDELPLREERVLKARPARPPQAASSPPGGFTPDPRPAAPGPQSADALRDLAKSNEPAAAAEAPRRAEPESRARAQVPAPAPQAAPAQEGARASGAVAALYVGPQRWLEQIAELRKEGKHDDADKLLEEFRKTYPDYRISDEMRAKVERPK